MQAKYFWTIAITVSFALEEALRNGLVPAQYVPMVSSATAFIGFVIQKVRQA